MNTSQRESHILKNNSKLLNVHIQVLLFHPMTYSREHKRQTVFVLVAMVHVSPLLFFCEVSFFFVKYYQIHIETEELHWELYIFL